ncbi:MAG TPA: hypothetical protein VK941_01745 [Gillisia sp.]|nr:hypothetical protein [Gillisia sp.]
MKGILLCVLAFLFFSCTGDDLNTIEESDFYGEWNLLSAEADREIDYNLDGDTASDIKDDLDCFTIELKLNPDNTFREIILDRPAFDDQVLCSISQSFGVWNYLKESNQIEFNYFDETDDLIQKVRSDFTITKNSSFIFSREFTDNNGSFKANLRFLFLN